MAQTRPPDHELCGVLASSSGAEGPPLMRKRSSKKEKASESRKGPSSSGEQTPCRGPEALGEQQGPLQDQRRAGGARPSPLGRPLVASPTGTVLPPARCCSEDIRAPAQPHPGRPGGPGHRVGGPGGGVGTHGSGSAHPSLDTQASSSFCSRLKSWTVGAGFLQLRGSLGNSGARPLTQGSVAAQGPQEHEGVNSSWDFSCLLLPLWDGSAQATVAWGWEVEGRLGPEPRLAPGTCWSMPLQDRELGPEELDGEWPRGERRGGRCPRVWLAGCLSLTPPLQSFSRRGV